MFTLGARAMMLGHQPKTLCSGTVTEKTQVPFNVRVQYQDLVFWREYVEKDVFTLVLSVNCTLAPCSGSNGEP